MTLREEFISLTEFFNQENMDYAIVGAFALYAYGYTRATRDVDFITRIEYQDKIVRHLESRGFETLNRSEGFSTHVHSVDEVRIDLIYVSGETADIIFGSTKDMTIFENFRHPVVSPEHLIALKLFAIHNEPSRKYKELADIKEIYKHTTIDKDDIREYFTKYNLEEYFDEISGEENSE